MSSPALNWDDLRFLVTLGREGTLAAAARSLEVDQTTVARRLRALEERLGAPLFVRHDGQWQPTPVGGEVLARAARIEEEVASLVSAAEAGAGEVSGVVRITAVSTLLASWLVPRLPEVYAQYPGLRLELLDADHNLELARREADIAIRLARPARGDFLIRKLADMGFALYGSAQPQQQAALSDWVAYLDDLAHTPEMRHLQGVLSGGRVRLRSNNLRSLVRAVADGVGHALLPCWLADAEPGVVRLSGPVPVLYREVWMVTHPDVRSQARVAAVADWLANCMVAEQAFLAGEQGAQPCVPNA